MNHQNYIKILYTSNAMIKKKKKNLCEYIVSGVFSWECKWCITPRPLKYFLCTLYEETSNHQSKFILKYYLMFYNSKLESRYHVLQLPTHKN